MKFNEYINYRLANGAVDKDGAYGYQCMDLYNDYCEKVLGLTNTGADCAKHILNNANIMNNVTRIDNTPEFVPQKGDIAVWTGGKYGHVAICLGEGDTNYFKSLDQNWKAQKLTEEKHNYIDYAPLVFLRPKNQESMQDNLQPQPTYGHKIGDRVVFSSYYASSTDGQDKAYIAKENLTGTITDIRVGARNPYLIDNGRCWINDGDIRDTAPTTPTTAYHVGQIVVYSTCYRGNNDTNYIDCKLTYGAWQQDRIVAIVGGKNPYKLNNGLYVNDGDIRMTK